ncbi:MAG: hypothetical protein OJF51_002900 [Nitrospira sp.]|nr:MAG: hypothetical protein OJF51_002900 [Nitrospira sp.]
MQPNNTFYVCQRSLESTNLPPRLALLKKAYAGLGKQEGLGSNRSSRGIA